MSAAAAALVGCGVDGAGRPAAARLLSTVILSFSLTGAQYMDNPGFLPKVEGLARRFGAVRRTRPDGNCFYRAYLFGIFEALVGSPERQRAFGARAQRSLDFCCSAGYERVAIEDFYEEFSTCLASLAAATDAPAALDAILKDSDDYLVCWTRCLTSRRRADFVAFLSSHSSIREFCAQEVDPMATEADQLQIVALSTHFGVPVNVVYLDRSEGEVAAEHLFKEGSEGMRTLADRPIAVFGAPPSRRGPVSVQVRRFITMIDAFYERHTKLVCTADLDPINLFQVTEDDKKTSVADEIFAWDRTASRLIEMQSTKYLSEFGRKMEGDQFMGMFNMSSLSDDDLHEFWRRYDRDDSGDIDHDELKLFLQDVIEATKGHRNVAPEVFDLCLSSMDTDGNGSISFEEFDNYLRHRDFKKPAWAS
ncbi:unnamed protein product [Prorocentrum cordatum]|uniref:ubiquitinyl hydrolase 1 n=1 Tax=Prorocentrum cordatum TaxID=2364126 RepID=A0ABN9UAM4_9DINO|nr:unnamed protein product [Polarella glacialis]